MRMVLIGDLQYQLGEEREILQSFAQLRALAPDLAVSMGDMGAPRELGRERGMSACAQLLKVLRCPVFALLGNHDVEYPPDAPLSGAYPAYYNALFGEPQPWKAFEWNGFFLLCLSIERQPSAGLRTRHGLYLSDGQFEWAKDQLSRHKDHPTVVLSHAPVAGSGLRCVPPIHSAATDAYLDHGYNAARWRDLLLTHPQIRLWGSAHFHMGQDYGAAISWAHQTTHVSTGVLTSAARDGSRHSRVLDFTADAIRIFTLDHRTETLHWDADVPLHASSQPSGCYAVRKPQEVLIGQDRATAVFDGSQWGKIYLATEEGRLWEYDQDLLELTGTICLSQKIAHLRQKDGRLYLDFPHGEGFSIGITDPLRFEILDGWAAQARIRESSPQGDLLPQIPFATRRAREGNCISWNNER